MSKFSKIISVMTCAAAALSAVSLPASAEENVIYGTMNIPYNEFFAAEGVESDVDFVSSATTAKWNNENLTAGTYGEANEDGTGVILGVTYPVAISAEDLAALGTDNYGFTELSEAPSSYKTVTLNGSKAEFSAVSGDSEALNGVTASITDSSVWGDYVIDVTSINNGNGTSDIGTIYGAVLFTSDGKGYAMRHLQNIWRDELAWSTGFVTTEPHGNSLDYENYVELMGKTITEIRYITDSGYHSISTSLYVPVKFDGSASVSDSTDGSGSTSVSISGFPSDFEKTYSVNGLDADISETEINYSNALAGQYTLTISDANGVYSSETADFVLSTDAMPAVYDGEKIVKADGADEEEFNNFMKNISVVSVNGTEYAASGRGSVVIVTEDGSIDYSVQTGGRDATYPVFDENSDEYELTVYSTGYNNALSFTTGVSDIPEDETISAEPEESEESEETDEIADNANNEADDNIVSGSSDSESESNPATGAAGTAAAVALAAAFAAVVFRKRK